MKKVLAVSMMFFMSSLLYFSCIKPFPLPPTPPLAFTPTPTPVCTPGTALTLDEWSILYPGTGPTSNALIRSLPQWNAYWTGATNPPALPSVDFATQMILIQSFTCIGNAYDQACYDNGGWTVDETYRSTYPNPCDPIGFQYMAVVLPASASPVSLSITIPPVTGLPGPITIPLSSPAPTPVFTPTSTPTPGPTVVVTVVP